MSYSQHHSIEPLDKETKYHQGFTFAAKRVHTIIFSCKLSITTMSAVADNNSVNHGSYDLERLWS